MLGGVAGRHMSNRRRGSSPMVRLSAGLPVASSLDGSGSIGGESGPAGVNAQYAPKIPPRRRRAVTTSDYKSCALIQTRLKLGDIMYKMSNYESDEILYCNPKAIELSSLTL
uniref:Uncharacterized protein n=1 Tax=Glossina palpalis gambiensis TaxID=67801 RepID=A0A1B0AMT2_9MUSC